MPKIKLTTPDGTKLEFDLTIDRATIGRAEDNDIVVPDGSVSSRHGEIHRKGDGIEIVDLGSTNGTHVGGARVERASIAPGGSFKLGSVEGLLISEAPAAAPEVSAAPGPEESSAAAGVSVPESSWSGAAAGASAVTTGLGTTPCPVRQRSGFGPKKKDADKTASLLMTLAVVSLLVCAAAALLIFKMAA